MDRVTFGRRRQKREEKQGWPSRPPEAVRSLNKLTTIWRRLPGRAFPVTVGKQASIMQTKKELYATDTGGRPLRLLLLLLVVVPYCLLLVYYTGGGLLLESGASAGCSKAGRLYGAVSSIYVSR